MPDTTNVTGPLPSRQRSRRLVINRAPEPSEVQYRLENDRRRYSSGIADPDQRLAEQLPDDDEPRWNHPQWLIERLRADWPDEWQDILEANNARAPMWLRANARRQTAADYQARLGAVDKASELLDGVPDAVRLVEPCGVDELPGLCEPVIEGWSEAYPELREQPQPYLALLTEVVRQARDGDRGTGAAPSDGSSTAVTAVVR